MTISLSLKRIRELDIEERVLLLPFRKNVIGLMREARILVMTSRFEGFGLVLVESLFAGTPVISNACNYGPSEIIKSEENGLLLKADASSEDFAQAISNLCRDTESYGLFTDRAKESVVRYHYESLRLKYREALRI